MKYLLIYCVERAGIHMLCIKMGRCGGRSYTREPNGLRGKYGLFSKYREATELDTSGKGDPLQMIKDYRI